MCILWTDHPRSTFYKDMDIWYCIEKVTSRSATKLIGRLSSLRQSQSTDNMKPDTQFFLWSIYVYFCLGLILIFLCLVLLLCTNRSDLALNPYYQNSYVCAHYFMDYDYKLDETESRLFENGKWERESKPEYVRTYLGQANQINLREKKRERK